MTRDSEQPDGPARPRQLNLFASLEPEAPPAPSVKPCTIDADLCELARHLPPNLHIGTSSWTFPGWRGLVYAKDASPKLLARHGLAAYAQHVLLNAVGIDRSFYAPMTVAEFAEYRHAVPPGFRFLVKAWAELTSPALRGRSGKNPRYLDVDSAIDLVIAPAYEGLGDRLGPLVFQFPPQEQLTREPAAFADRLHTFFSRLPKGPLYAAELRDAALFTERYVQALSQASAHHCFCVHPRMPTIARQRELVPIEGPVTVRWMLHAGLSYEQAKSRYEPFDKLVDPDPVRRQEIAALAVDALARSLPVTIVVNNKAEGSAPRSVQEIVRQIMAMTIQPPW